MVTKLYNTTLEVDLTNYQDLIRDVPDFPKQGILFKDITPLLNSPIAFNKTIKDMCYQFRNEEIDAIVAIEARGYIFGAPIAHELQAGFIPVRKQGKLPWNTTSIEYSLEYGSAVLEIHKDALRRGQKVLIVDDVLATGGTINATINLIEQAGAEIAGIVVLIELLELRGAELFNDYKVTSILKT